MEDFVYNKYIRTRGEKIESALGSIIPTYKKMKIDGIVKLNSCDKIRLERFDHEALNNEDVYEFVLLDHIERLLETTTNRIFPIKSCFIIIISPYINYAVILLLN